MSIVAKRSPMGVNNITLIILFYVIHQVRDPATATLLTSAPKFPRLPTRIGLLKYRSFIMAAL